MSHPNAQNNPGTVGTYPNSHATPLSLILLIKSPCLACVGTWIGKVEEYRPYKKGQKVGHKACENSCELFKQPNGNCINSKNRLATVKPIAHHKWGANHT